MTLISERVETTAPVVTRKKRDWSVAGRVAALLIAAVFVLGPVLWTLSTSLRPPSESFKLPPAFLPLNPDLASYQQVFKQLNIVGLVLNSALVTGLIAVGMAGMINASSVSESPTPRISMNTGTIVTCAGTIMVARTIENRAPRPLKRRCANA